MASAFQYKRVEKQVNEKHNDLLHILTLTVSGLMPILISHKATWNLYSMYKYRKQKNSTVFLLALSDITCTQRY